VGLTRSEAVSFSSQLRLRNRVVLDSRPFIHPFSRRSTVGGRRVLCSARQASPSCSTGDSASCVG
jgi:hypothetical protein